MFLSCKWTKLWFTEISPFESARETRVFGEARGAWPPRGIFLRVSMATARRRAAAIKVPPPEWRVNETLSLSPGRCMSERGNCFPFLWKVNGHRGGAISPGLTEPTGQTRRRKNGPRASARFSRTVTQRCLNLFTVDLSEHTCVKTRPSHRTERRNSWQFSTNWLMCREIGHKFIFISIIIFYIYISCNIRALYTTQTLFLTIQSTFLATQIDSVCPLAFFKNLQLIFIY